jgi:alpha-L-rhamnosidase
MKRYMNFLDSLAVNSILPSGWIGDWGSMVKDLKEVDPKSIPTAYYFWNAKIMSKVSAILGKSADEAHFRKLAEDVREKYNSKFLNTGTANYEDGSQMANAFPLYLGIVPENLESRVLNNLVKDSVVNNNNHLTTGVLGTKYMPEALAQLGRADVAWEIINQKSAPSWNDMMRRYTTVCEFWTLKQSKNHVMMGSIDAWFYRYIAGIQSDEKNAAFSSFIVKPQLLDSLGSAKSRIETMRGTISSEWKNDNGQFTLKIGVPFNTTAIVYIPTKENKEITEGGIPISQVEGIENLGYKNDAYLIKVHSGNYVFTTHKNK